MRGVNNGPGRPHSQLTKRARLGRESERFTSKGHNRAAVGWSARWRPRPGSARVYIWDAGLSSQHNNPIKMLNAFQTFLEHTTANHS